MKKYLTQSSLFKALIFLATLGIVYDVFHSLIFPFGLNHPFAYFGFAKPTIISGMISILIGCVFIVTCKLKLRIAFFLIFIVASYHLFISNPLVGRPISWLFKASTPLEMNVVILLKFSEATIALLGVVLVIAKWINELILK